MLKLLAEGATESSWFFLTEPVQRFIGNKLEVGDTVQIEVTDGEEEGSKLITKITGEKLTSNANSGNSSSYSSGAKSWQNKGGYNKSSYSKPAGNSYSKPAYTGYGKSPQEQEQIARLAIFHDAARISSTLGLKDVNEVVEATTSIYTALYNAFKASLTKTTETTDVAV